MTKATRSKATVIDGDGTLWKGMVSTSVGEGLLHSEAKKALAGALRLSFKESTEHFATLRRGIEESRRINRIFKENYLGYDSEIAGLERFYSMLKELEIGTSWEMHALARKHIMENKVGRIVAYIRSAQLHNEPVFLSTASGSSAASEAARLYDLNGIFSSTEKFENDKIAGLSINFRTPEEKLHYTEEGLQKKFGISVVDCVVIGNSWLDYDLLKNARISVASPYATDEIRRVARLQL